MSSLNDINNERELRIVHDTKDGLISVAHFDEYQNNDFTVDVSTEDFVTMLKWYFYQKEKSETLGPIQWNEEEQAISDKLYDDMKSQKTVDEVIAGARAKYEDAIQKTIDSGKADKILHSRKAQNLKSLDDIVKN